MSLAIDVSPSPFDGLLDPLLTSAIPTGRDFRAFFTPILWALILARLFYSLYEYLSHLLRGQTTLSAALSTLAVTLIAVLPVAYLAFLATHSGRLHNGFNSSAI